MGRYQLWQPFGENALFTRRIVTKEAANFQDDLNCVAAARQILELSLIVAVYSLAQLLTTRALALGRA